MERRINRRRHVRYVLEPAYTPVAVRTLESERFDNEGHAYDISEGGVRFEADRAIAPGSPIAIQITLPVREGDLEAGRSVLAFGNVVWQEDEEEPGPVKMAATFTHFARLGDRERLVRKMGSGRWRMAA
jgi:hypothetical protein